MKRKIQVAVIGDSREIEINNQIAYSAGQFIAENGWALISGGRGGVMEAASKGASEKGGLVVSVLPGADLGEGNPYASVKIPTGIGWARNSINVLSGDIIIAIGGGAGTLSELAYAWCFRKPILSCAWASGWSERLAGDSIDSTWDMEITSVETMGELKEKLIAEINKLD